MRVREEAFVEVSIEDVELNVMNKFQSITSQLAYWTPRSKSFA